jgi:hypothetical protein
MIPRCLKPPANGDDESMLNVLNNTIAHCKDFCDFRTLIDCLFDRFQKMMQQNFNALKSIENPCLYFPALPSASIQLYFCSK